jgi:hypothetical protein
MVRAMEVRFPGAVLVFADGARLPELFSRGREFANARSVSDLRNLAPDPLLSEEETWQRINAVYMAKYGSHAAV